jgi:hypothetical protein
VLRKRTGWNKTTATNTITIECNNVKNRQTCCKQEEKQKEGVRDCLIERVAGGEF